MVQLAIRVPAAALVVIDKIARLSDTCRSEAVRMLLAEAIAARNRQARRAA